MYRYDENITDGHYQRINPSQELSSGFNMKFVIRVGSIYVDKTHVSLKMELASGLVAETMAEEEYFEIKKRPSSVWMKTTSDRTSSDGMKILY